MAVRIRLKKDIYFEVKERKKERRNDQVNLFIYLFILGILIEADLLKENCKFCQFQKIVYFIKFSLNVFLLFFFELLEYFRKSHCICSYQNYVTVVLFLDIF